jgi:hypothetical protein
VLRTRHSYLDFRGRQNQIQALAEFVICRPLRKRAPQNVAGASTQENIHSFLLRMPADRSKARLRLATSKTPFLRPFKLPENRVRSIRATEIAQTLLREPPPGWARIEPQEPSGIEQKPLAIRPSKFWKNHVAWCLRNQHPFHIVLQGPEIPGCDLILLHEARPEGLTVNGDFGPFEGPVVTNFWQLVFSKFDTPWTTLHLTAPRVINDRGHPWKGDYNCLLTQFRKVQQNRNKASRIMINLHVPPVITSSLFSVLVGPLTFEKCMPRVTLDGVTRYVTDSYECFYPTVLAMPCPGAVETFICSSCCSRLSLLKTLAHDLRGEIRPCHPIDWTFVLKIASHLFETSQWLVLVTDVKAAEAELEQQKRILLEKKQTEPLEYAVVPQTTMLDVITFIGSSVE